jgi:GT2 family glycosyltransferase
MSARGSFTIRPQSAKARGSSDELRDAGVTFVIPAKDRAALLAETLRSVREQTRRAEAVIVCDDGSTEDVEGVANEAEAIVLRNERGDWGSAGARNAGLAEVKTAFVWFLDSDDLLLPDAVDRLYRALVAAGDAPFAYGDALQAHRQGGRWQPWDLMATTRAERRNLLSSIYVRNTVPSPCALVRTDAAREVGGFDPGATYSEDHLFWIRLAQRGMAVYVAEPVGIYRRHSAGRHTPLAALPDNLRIAAIGESDPRLGPHRPARYGVLLLETVSDCLHRKRPDLALGVLWRLLIRQPNRLAIARSAGRHFRWRRHAHREALALWRDRPDIREWLASFR